MKMNGRDLYKTEITWKFQKDGLNKKIRYQMH